MAIIPSSRGAVGDAVSAFVNFTDDDREDEFRARRRELEKVYDQAKADAKASKAPDAETRKLIQEYRKLDEVSRRISQARKAAKEGRLDKEDVERWALEIIDAAMGRRSEPVKPLKRATSPAR